MFSFLHILASPCYLLPFDKCHSKKYEVISHYSFDFHFPDDKWCWACFPVSVGCLYFFGKMSNQILCPFILSFFRAAPVAHRGNLARGVELEPAAASLYHSHSNMGSNSRLQPTPQLRQHQILNPLNKARDRTRTATSWFLVGFIYHCAMTGTPKFWFLSVNCLVLMEFIFLCHVRWPSTI